MKNLIITTLFIALTVSVFAQKGEYFVYANTNNYVPSTIKNSIFFGTKSNTHRYEEYILGVGIEKRTRDWYTRTDVEMGLDRSVHPDNLQNPIRKYQLIRMGIGVNLFNKENGFLMSMGTNLGAGRHKISAYSRKFDRYRRINGDRRNVEKYQITKDFEGKSEVFVSGGFDLNVEFPISERVNVQVRHNFYIYTSDGRYFITGINYNSMAGISCRLF